MTEFNTPEEYEAIKQGLSPESFRNLPKEDRRELMNNHNNKLNPYGLIVKDKSKEKAYKLAWLVCVILLGAGFLYLGYNDYYKSSVAFSPNISLSCPDNQVCPTLPNIPACPSCPSFPSELKLKIVNST